MCREVKLSYGWSDARAPTGARAFCRDQLSAMFADAAASAPVQDAAALIVSELVTNAVNAGSRELDVTLAAHRDHLRIAVRDDAPGRPEPRSAAPTDSHGRGLEIVAALSHRWGVDPSPDGKQVWAVLSVPAATMTSMPCTTAALIA